MTPYYKVVLFDADDTLFDFHAAEKQSLQIALTHMGLPFSEDTFELYHAINLSLWEMLERGEIEMSDIRVRRFEQLFSKMSWQGDFRHTNEIFMESLGRGTIIFDGAEQLCRELSRSVKLYLATNGFSRTQRDRLAGSALKPYFSGLFISEELGARKPQPEFFDAALTSLGDISKSDILMVGDRVTADIAGAVAAGIDNCWYNPERLENKSGITPTYEVASLAEITGIVFRE